MRKCLLSFIATLYFGLFSFFQARSQCGTSNVAQPANQEVRAGSNSGAVNFTSSVSGSTFGWTNSNPAIGLAASGIGNIPSFTTTNSSTAPLTGTITVTPYKGTTDFAYVANYDAHTVSVINALDNSVVTTITVGTNPTAVAISPNGFKAYVVNSGSKSISVINTATNTVETTIAVGANLGGMTISPDGTKLYVANTNNGVIVIDAVTNTVNTTIPVGSLPINVAISPDGSRLYVANNDVGTVIAINTANNSIIKTITVGQWPYWLTVSPNGEKVYVANYGANSISVINTSTHTVEATIGVGNTPFGVAVSPDNAKVFVTNYFSNNVSVINAATNTVSATISVGSNPYGVSVTPDGSKAYIANNGSNNISVINTSDNSTIKTFAVGDGPKIFGTNIFTKFNSCTAGMPKTFTITINPVPDVAAISNQTVCVGTNAAAIDFTSSVAGTTFKWTNSNPDIGLPASGSGNIPSFTATNMTGSPISASIKVTPYYGTANYAYIANNGSGTVSVINTGTNNVVATIPVGTWPYRTIVTPDRTKVYVANSGFGEISVINTADNTVVKTINTGGSPFDMAIAPDGSKLYVTDFSGGNVFVIRTVDNTLDKTIAVGDRPDGIAITPDGSKVYVVKFGAQNVSVINTATNTVETTLTTGKDPRRVAITPDGSKAYVVNYGSGTVSVIKTADNTIIGTISVGTNPHGIAISSDGAKAYVANIGSNDVSVIKLIDNTVTATIPVGKWPHGVAISPDGKKAYVANNGDGTVSVINTANHTVSETISVGSGPTIWGNDIFNQYNSYTIGTPQDFTITVNTAPASPIISYSGSTTFCEGGSLTLTSSAATGNQWYNGTSLISGATGKTYIATTSGDYTVKVTNTCGTTASTAHIAVTVNPAPATPIVSTTGTTTLCPAGSVILTSSATAGNQWYNGSALITGATTQSYTVTAAGSYHVKVTNASCTSAASASVDVTMSSAPLTPTISTSGSTTFCEGGSVILTSSATTGNQWYKGSDPIAGATAQSYTATASGNYTVKVSDACGTGASLATIAVTVNPIPVKPTITAVGNVLTSSSSTGNQWYLEGAPISGAVSQTYSVEAAGRYTVQVTQSGCSSISDEHNFVSTRVNEPEAWNGEVFAYPTPVEQVLYLKNKGSRKLQWQLFDCFGRKVREGQLNTTTGSINVQGLAAGVYQLVFTDLQKKQTISQTILKR